MIHGRGYVRFVPEGIIGSYVRAGESGVPFPLIGYGYHSSSEEGSFKVD